MTYQAGEEFDYIERLKPYATDTITNTAYRFPGGSTSTVLYAEAYKQTQYSPTQYDVWVMTTTAYTTRLVSEDGVVEKGTKFVIWTTTPWTLPANLGIAVHPDFEYQVVKYNGESYLVAKEE